MWRFFSMRARTCRVPAATLCASILMAGAGCISRPRDRIPVAFLFPTLYSTQILDQVTPFSISAMRLGDLLDRLGVGRELRRAGLSERELAVVSRGLRSRGYAELDARKSAVGVRWVSFRGERASGGTPMLHITAGFWARPDLPREFVFDVQKDKAKWHERCDPYGVPQLMQVWAGKGPYSPVLRRVVDAFDHSQSHWEFEVAVPPGTVGSPGPGEPPKE